MIEFVILDPDNPDATMLEFVRVMVSYDLITAYYDPSARSFKPEQVAAFWTNAGRMKGEDGETVHVAPVRLSNKMKAAPDAMQAHIRAYFDHPIRYLVARDIAAMTANWTKENAPERLNSEA